jgi:hypothetical protein
MPYDFYGLYMFFIVVIAIGAANREDVKAILESNEATEGADMATNVYMDAIYRNSDGTIPQIIDRELYYITKPEEEEALQGLDEIIFNFCNFFDGYGWCPEYWALSAQIFDNALYDFMDSFVTLYWECIWIWFFFFFKPFFTAFFFSLESYCAFCCFLAGFTIIKIFTLIGAILWLFYEILWHTLYIWALHMPSFGFWFF